jgi:mRNA deadenylase 3'-5' endonuclease subunit Ccr4
MGTSPSSSSKPIPFDWKPFEPKCEWLDVPDKTQILAGGPNALQASSDERIKILSFNILAQTLIRRDMFPTSSQRALKWTTRRENLAKEVSVYQADIMCLQEVDFYEEFWRPNVVENKKTGYGGGHWTRKSGNRADGCAVIWRASKFALEAFQDLDYNTLCSVEPYANGGQGSDLSELTRGNLGQIVALRLLPRSGTFSSTDGMIMDGKTVQKAREEGVIIFNTHLFWNPNYNYVRLIQIVVALEQIVAFKKTHGLNWPVVMCGDWNHSSGDPSYEAIFERSQLEQLWHRHTCWLAHHLHNSKYQAWIVPPPKEVLEAEEPKPKPPQDEAEKEARWARVSQILSRLERGDLPCPTSIYKYYIEADPTNPDYEGTNQPSRFEPPLTSYSAWWCGPLDYIATFSPVDQEIAKNDVITLIPKRFMKIPNIESVGPRSDFQGGKYKNAVQFPNDVRASDHFPIMVEFMVQPK